MATGIVLEEDQSLWQEQTRLFNFLKHYDLHKYFSKFVDSGVKRLTHLKDVAVDDASLNEIGLTRPERIRLRKKVKENVESYGKFKNWLLGKSNRFDDPAPEVGGPPAHEPTVVRSRAASVIPKDQIRLGDKIGEGAHGSVHRGVWSDVHGSVSVAVKRLYGRQEVQTQFIKEANSMCSLDHPNIIKLYGIVLSEPLMLIEELAPLGNLYSYLHKHGGRLTLRGFHSYAYQIVDAMRYLEKNRILHRDLATRNILLLQEDSVKLSDFGMARVLDDHSEVYNLSNLGARIPVAWTAIEALTSAKFSTSSDVWSYAVVLWEIYSLGETPFEGLSPVEIRDMLLRGERLGRPERCPTGMYDIMKSCWNLSPHDRPSFTQLHQRIETCSPSVVRAIQSHDVAEDPSYLSFKTGELIYVIDKPKPEWIFGMSADGSIGQLSSDNVTNVVAALDDIKAKVNSGKVKAANLSISDPTSVDHMMHWGRDGTKWQVNEQDVGVLGRYTPPGSSPVTSPKQNGHSSPQPTNPKSPYLQLGSARSPSPSGQQSPLVNVTSSTTSVVTMTTAESSNRPPSSQYASSQHVESTEPDLGYEITYGDTKFMGHQRYVANRASYASDHSSPQHTTSAEGVHASAVSPLQLQTQISEDNSYIVIGRTNLPDQDVVQRLSQVNVHATIGDSHEEQEDGYIRMGPHSVLAANLHGYINIPPNASSQGYAVPRTFATTTAVDVHVQRRSILDNDVPTAGSTLPDPIYPMSSNDGHVVSQYSVAGAAAMGDAMMPRSYRFLNSTSRPPTNSQSFTNTEDSTHPREVLTSIHRHSQKEVWSPPGEHQADTNPPVPKPRQSFSSDLSRRSSSDRTNSQTSAAVGITALHPRPGSRVGIHGNPAFDSIRNDPEFSDCASAVIRNSLQKHDNNFEKAKQEIRINKLLDMGIPNINEADCERALSHCQQKTDRAAEWLLQMSDDIEERAQ